VRIRRAIQKADDTGEPITVRYRKKSTGRTVTRTAEFLEEKDGMLWVHHDGHAKSLIMERIREARTE